MRFYASLLIVTGMLFLNAPGYAIGEEVRSILLGVGHHRFVPFKAGQLYGYVDGEFVRSKIDHDDISIAMASVTELALCITGGFTIGTTEIIVETVDHERFKFNVEVVASDDPRVASSTAKPIQLGLGYSQILNFKHLGRQAELVVANTSIDHYPLSLGQIYLVGRDEGVSDLSIIQEKEIVTYRVTVVPDGQRNENQPPHEEVEIEVGATLELKAPKDFALPDPDIEFDPDSLISSPPWNFVALPSLIKLSLDKQKPLATGLKPGATDLILMSRTGAHQFYRVVVKAK